MILFTVFGYLIQTFLTRATLLKKASYILPLGYFGIVLAFVVDVTIFSVDFGFWEIVGIVLASGGLSAKLFLKET